MDFKLFLNWIDLPWTESGADAFITVMYASKEFSLSNVFSGYYIMLISFFSLQVFKIKTCQTDAQLNASLDFHQTLIQCLISDVASNIQTSDINKTPNCFVLALLNHIISAAFRNKVHSSTNKHTFPECFHRPLTCFLCGDAKVQSNSFSTLACGN